VQTRKVTSFPVILYNSGYWSGLLDWGREKLVGEGMVSAEDLDLLNVTDDVDEIVDIIERAEANRYGAAADGR
jgi:predicted Rossmann-fold nucleotide-binding protein